MNPSFVFDIICLATLLLLAWRYARKGLLATLMQMFGNLFSLLGARAFAAWGSPLVFENFLAVGFRQKIAASITASGTADLTEIVEKYAGFLPESFRASIIDTFERSVTAALENNAVLLADSIVTNVIKPLITPVISIVLFFVAFAVCRMVVSMLVTVLGLVNKLPVIGTVNRTLGWGMGFATALLDVFFGVCIVWALIVITGGGISWLNEAALGNSVFYRLFNVLNPFV
jgi:hypothetical protein